MSVEFDMDFGVLTAYCCRVSRLSICASCLFVYGGDTYRSGGRVAVYSAGFEGGVCLKGAESSIHRYFVEVVWEGKDTGRKVTTLLVSTSRSG